MMLLPCCSRYSCRSCSLLIGPDLLLLEGTAAARLLLLLLYVGSKPELSVCWLAVAVPVVAKGLVLGGCKSTCTSGSKDSGHAPVAELLCFR
jgi:hypothetical protein